MTLESAQQPWKGVIITWKSQSPAHLRTTHCSTTIIIRRKRSYKQGIRNFSSPNMSGKYFVKIFIPNNYFKLYSSYTVTMVTQVQHYRFVPKLLTPQMKITYWLFVPLRIHKLSQSQAKVCSANTSIARYKTY